MRIAFDIAAIARGGAERQVLETACGLQDRRHDVLLIANKAAEDYTEYLDRLLVWELHRMSRWDARVVGDIRCALRRFRADVCVCVSFTASLWGRLAAASLGCKVVVAEHATRAETPFVIGATNLLLRGVTDRVIACAEAQVDSLVQGGHRLDRITVIRNGVDVRRFSRDGQGAARVRHELDVPAGAPVVMLVAAHRPEKRQDRFVSLLESLHDSGTQAWGLMVGGGSQLEHTVELARASRVAPFLRVCGPRRDMPAVYSAADVVVLVSDVDTFPLCFLEAAACGVPVVGMDSGGVRETMINGETGYLVDRNDLDGMASIIGGLIADHELCQSMGRAGGAFVEHHLSLDAMIEAYERVLVETATPRGRKA